MKSALRYHGSKFALSPWIVSHFPKAWLNQRNRLTYLEPFFGSGAILCHKPRTKHERVCEIDTRITDFFEVLRTRPNDLVTVLNLTPYSREEFQRCFGEVDPNHIDPGLERARRLFVTSWQSIGGLTEDMQNSWRCVNGISKSHKAPCEYWTFDHLLEIAERYQNIEIDNRDALEIIRKMNSPEVLIYADPPYLKETRVRPEKTYKFEPDPEDDESWHQELLKLLINHHGPAYLSGDFSELYDSNLVNWQRVETQVKTNSNSSRIATECLWINESAQFAIEHEKLATGHQLSLELV